MAFMKNTIKIPNVVTFTVCLIFAAFGSSPIAHAALRAGAAKVDITHPNSKHVSSPLYSRALVVQGENTTIVLVSMDVVAIGGIGYIKNDFLPNVRRKVKESLGIDGTSILINASHCHGMPSPDSEALTVQAIEAAYQNLEEVTVGVGSGSEDRIMENRRMFLKSGREIDVRHAYSLPPNKDIAGTGPIDPEIGILLLRKLNGETLAAVYNFACHPIQGVPNGENTADITGFSGIVARQPGHLVDFDTLFRQLRRLFLAGIAVDIALLHFAMVNLARFLGEVLANIIEILFDHIAHLTQCLYCRTHLLRGWCFRRQRDCGGWRAGANRCAAIGATPATALAGAGRNIRRHRRFFDLLIAAHRALYFTVRNLAFETARIGKPRLEHVLLRAF